MSPRRAFIANLGASVFPFTHRHLGLPRGIIAGPLQLKIAVLIAHHPVIGNTSLGLQAEHLLQFARCRWLAVIVLRLGRLARKPCVVLGQIFFLQETIPRFVRADLLTSHLLDQAILVRAIAFFRWARAHTRFSKLCRAPAARRTFRSIAASPAPPPRSFPARPGGLLPSRSRRPPCSSGTPFRPGPDTSHGNCRPSAPARQSARADRAACAAACACVPCSTDPPTASTAAAFPDELAVDLRSPSALPPASARSRRTFSPLFAESSSAVWRAALGWTLALHSHA